MGRDIPIFEFFVFVLFFDFSYLRYDLFTCLLSFLESPGDRAADEFAPAAGNGSGGAWDNLGTKYEEEGLSGEAYWERGERMAKRCGRRKRGR